MQVEDEEARGRRCEDDAWNALLRSSLGRVHALRDPDELIWKVVEVIGALRCGKEDRVDKIEIM
jgi:hypothetical protein